MIKIVFVPGNGGATTQDNWFPSVKKSLEEAGFLVISSPFPDPNLARASYWIPFLHETLKVDHHTILVGHSSGSLAALRYSEQYPIQGSVLVGAYYTDLGIEKEKQSGYFNLPWDWQSIGQNQRWTVLFSSQDDPWIPIDQPRYIHKELNCEYHEFKNQGHFGGDYYKAEFPELVLAILRNTSKKVS